MLVLAMVPERAWTSEKLYFDNEKYFDAVFAAIDSANASIDVEMYIFNPDRLGRIVEEKLEQASQRGVRVRILIDGIGALSWVGAWRDSLPRSGAEIKIYNPVYSGPFWSGIIRTIKKRGLARFFLHINRRTHRKYIIVDGKRVFMGSQNVSEDHLKRFCGKDAWRDIGAELSGPAVNHFINAFEHAWDRSYTPDGKRKWFRRKRAPRLHVDSAVRLNLTPWLRRKFWRDLLYRIRHAKQRVWIISPYLSPTRFLLRSLIKASRRGVDVRILLPSRSDVFFMRWVANSYYKMLVANGIRVFEYKPSFLHSKSIVIDDWTTVGTTNLNLRSFLRDLEVDVVISSAEEKRRLQSEFLSELKESREITFEKLSERTFVARLGRIVSLFMRYWV